MQSQDGIVAPDQVTSIRHVGINRGVEWIGSGFNLFMKKPAELIIAGLILFVVSLILNFVPIIGSGLATMAGVVAAGVFMRASQAIEEGIDPIAAGKVAAAATPLYILGIIAAGLGVAIALLGWVFISMAIAAAFFSPFAAVGMAGLTGILMMLISIPLIMALWLAPGLVIMKGTQPLDAVRLSFVASMKNFLPFMIFYILAAIASFIGAMLLGLGLIFVYPVLLCAAYVAYKDIFGTVTNGEAVGYIQQAP